MTKNNEECSEENIERQLTGLIILQIFELKGISSVKTIALETAIDFFNIRMNSILCNLASKIHHARRNYLNFFDLCKEKHFSKAIEFVQAEDFSCQNSVRLDDKLEYQQYQPVEKWESPLENKKEKIIHLYEWLPELPPIFTYRRTPLSESTTKSEALNMKNKVTQSLKSEENLFKLFKTSNSIPPFINYLYQSKK